MCEKTLPDKFKFVNVRKRSLWASEHRFKAKNWHWGYTPTHTFKLQVLITLLVLILMCNSNYKSFLHIHKTEFSCRVFSQSVTDNHKGLKWFLKIVSCLFRWSLCQNIHYRVIKSRCDSAERPDRLHVGPRPIRAWCLSQPAWCHQEQECKQTWRLIRTILCWKADKIKVGTPTVSFPLFQFPPRSSNNIVPLCLQHVYRWRALCAPIGQHHQHDVEFVGDTVRRHRWGVHYDSLHEIIINCRADVHYQALRLSGRADNVSIEPDINENAVQRLDQIKHQTLTNTVSSPSTPADPDRTRTTEPLLNHPLKGVSAL